MRTCFQLLRGRAPVWLQVCCIAVACAPALHGFRQAPGPGDWPRVHIEDAFTRAAVEWALTGAAQWLASQRCRTVLSEFQDEEGRALAERLEVHGVDAQRYLALILFRDGSRSAQCAGDTTFAVTSTGGRVVFVCGRRFERLWRTTPHRARAVVIHEMLHTLGLGEDPPPSRVVTARILALCDAPPAPKPVRPTTPAGRVRK